MAAVLRQVQNFDPVGVAARDLRECLLIAVPTQPHHSMAKPRWIKCSVVASSVLCPGWKRAAITDVLEVRKVQRY
ncbi:MAG: hypothetical protein GKR94_28210 [Gammaproteobacteria bacterium]|nr:hypothetical protein [Gammaproteobacteria bacterium]